ncbi:TonB C-terminal domain-containing protein [Tardiphaga sp. 768_D3_N2_1]|uniref:TonB C-terminal domain-containing protein n=1 Tax=Tardiphaga sp. 768_D3_N2_1 TaxID=3240783 RepID=UPI003F8928CA
MLALWFNILTAIILPSAALSDTPAQGTELWFDIPSQPLVSALEKYSAATGIVGLYHGNLAIGRMSKAVAGRFTPAAALLLLLQDSNLIVEYAAPNAFVIVPARDEVPVIRTASSIAHAALSQQDSLQQRYSGLLQAKVNDSLCAQVDARPGDYRIALSFRIGPEGNIQQLRLLGSSGTERRDRAIMGALQGMVVGEAPPAPMAQPFTMIILPRSAGGAVECRSVESGQRHG